MHYSEFFSSYASFLWLDTLLNFSVSLLAILIFNDAIKIFGYNASLVISVFLLTIFIIPVALKFGLQKVRISNKFLGNMILKINQVVETTFRIISDKALLAKVTLVGLISLTLHYLLLYSATNALGINLGFVELLIMLAVLKLSLIFNITPGNVGTREIVYGALGSSFSLKFSEGIILSTLLRINSYIVVVSLGLIFGAKTLLKDIK